MGSELNKYQRRKKAEKTLDEIHKERGKFLIIHYSCESFYEIKDGRTPRITSIAIRNFETAQTVSFSIHKCAELDQVKESDISSDFDKFEKKMLDDFFKYIEKQGGYKFVHWNMRDMNYGFQAIEHRYKVLGGNPVVVDDTRKYDLSRLFVALYGNAYIQHPRLSKLMEKNKITSKDSLSGEEESKAFENGEYIKLHQSTLRKVDTFANFLDRAIDGSLKTNASWFDKNGVHPKIITEYIQKHWVFGLIIIVIALFSVYKIFS